VFADDGGVLPDWIMKTPDRIIAVATISVAETGSSKIRLPVRRPMTGGI
jgi:hypothetical protein